MPHGTSRYILMLSLPGTISSRGSNQTLKRVVNHPMKIPWPHSTTQFVNQSISFIVTRIEKAQPFMSVFVKVWVNSVKIKGDVKCDIKNCSII